MLVQTSALRSFAEPVILRDPKARTRTPGIAVRDDTLEIRGPVQVRQRFRVSRDQGATFVSVTDDPNGIHTDGDIVPGAYLWAKVLFGLEVLMPQLEILEMKTRFASPTHYGESMLSELRYAPAGGDRVGIEVKILRAGDVVSSSVIHGRRREQAVGVDVARKTVNSEELQRVFAFSGALGIDPDAYFEKAGQPDYSYPFSFLASLPSGALVRSLSGEGGVLGALKLSFLAENKRPIVGPGPEVTVQRPKRWRKTFNRIMTAIKEGVHTYLKGSALVGRPRGLVEGGATG